MPTNSTTEPTIQLRLPNDADDADCATCGAVLASLADVFRHECPPPTPPPAPAPTRRTAAPDADVRRNRFPGWCADCHHRVPEGEGILTRNGAAWEVRCDPCPPASDLRPDPDTLPDVPAGHYAIRSNGANDLEFLRVDRPTEGRWAGRVFVKRVVGGRPDRNVPRAAAAGYLQRILDADPAKAMALYGREIGRCGVCNRHLTDEVSRSLGIGPTCRSGR